MLARKNHTPVALALRILFGVVLCGLSYWETRGIVTTALLIAFTIAFELVFQLHGYAMSELRAAEKRYDRLLPLPDMVGIMKKDNIEKREVQASQSRSPVMESRNV